MSWEHLFFIIGMVFLKFGDDIGDGGIFVEGELELHFSIED